MSLVDEARAVRERIAARLQELEPLVAEYHELQKIAAEMGLQGDELLAASTAAHVDEPLPASTAAPADEPIAASPAAHGDEPVPAPRAAPEQESEQAAAIARARRARSRAQDAATQASSDADDLIVVRVLEAVRAHPGKTVAEYAELLKLAPGTLYRPVRELTTEGALVKRARQLFAA